MSKRLAAVTAVLCFCAGAADAQQNRQGRPQSNTQPQAPVALFLFGGESNRTYLGCLNCDEFHADSVRNEYGRYGSPYSATSILNPYGPYGGPFAPMSPCNPFGQRPPRVVDSEGRFYGVLTVNEHAHQRLTDSRINRWLNIVCRD